MALSTYAELQDSVLRWLTGCELEQMVPDFIALAEAQMNRDLAAKPLRPMVTRADLTIDDEYGDAPADLLRPVSFSITSTDPVVKLEHVAPENLARMKADQVNEADCLCVVGGSSTTPRWYTHVGSELQFYPAPADGESYTGELTYVQKIPALSDDNTSNWLLSAHPDAYLYGALVQAAQADDKLAARAGGWVSAYASALEAVKRAYPSETNKSRLRTDIPLSRCY